MDLIVFRHFSSFLPHLQLPVPVPLLLTKGKVLSRDISEAYPSIHSIVYYIVNAHYTSILYSYTLRR